MPPDLSSIPRLSPAEIKDLLDEFNKTNHWEVFDKVGPLDYVNIMYPHQVKPVVLDIETMPKSVTYGKLG